MQNEQETGEREVFILLNVDDFEQLERVIKQIERAGGRILQSYPLDVLMAVVPAPKIESLRSIPGIESVDTDPIGDQRAERMNSTRRYAVDLWNAHLQPGAGQTPGAGQPWDAPGFLPPDPPADIRKMLEEREEEMRRQMDSGEEDE